MILSSTNVQHRLKGTQIQSTNHNGGYQLNHHTIFCRNHIRANELILVRRQSNDSIEVLGRNWPLTL